MTPEQLQAALNALMEAGLDGDALSAATKALTDAFSSTATVSDDEATDAMAPDMAATFRAEGTSAEDKAGLLEIGRFNARQIKVAVALATAKAGTGKANKADAPLTLAALQAELPKMLLKALPPQGRTGNASASPVAGDTPAGSAGFSAKIKTLETTGVSRSVAIQTLAQSDRTGFNEWSKAGRPNN